MNYRFDNRSEAEFRKDIKDRTLMERDLFLQWIKLIEKKEERTVTYEEFGCGNDGEFLEEKKVNSQADFNVDGYGLLEVKFSKPLLTKVFHLKLSQVKKYITQDASVLMINGAETDCPEFTILDVESLKKILQDCKTVKWGGFGGKMSLRITVGDFVWRKLKE